MPIQTSTVLKSRASRVQPFLAVGYLLAACTLPAAAVELGGEDSEDDHGHDHHGDDEKTSHREYDVSQQLQCEGMDANREFTSALMEKFENLEELAVEWVSQSGQGSARLTPSSRAFTISN